MSNILSKIYSPVINDYIEINDDEYYSSFGLIKKNNAWKIKKKEKEKIEYAYRKAWENRDFEINKFWTRAAYFWGFIALIFVAYFKISENEIKNKYIQLIIICLGIIFSIAWNYVIRGSKKWQENWENHIDKLEDFISGPLYKTIFHKDTFYSVSKINEILSIVIIVVWLAMLINFLNLNSFFSLNNNSITSFDFKILFTLIITFLFSISIIFGYSKKKYNNKKNSFIRRDSFSK